MKAKCPGCHHWVKAPLEEYPVGTVLHQCDVWTWTTMDAWRILFTARSPADIGGETLANWLFEE